MPWQCPACGTVNRDGVPCECGYVVGRDRQTTLTPHPTRRGWRRLLDLPVWALVLLTLGCLGALYILFVLAMAMFLVYGKP